MTNVTNKQPSGFNLNSALLMIALCVSAVFTIHGPAQAANNKIDIVSISQKSQIDQYAAAELKKYLLQAFSVNPQIKNQINPSAKYTFILTSDISTLPAQYKNQLNNSNLKSDQGYLLKTIPGENTLIIAAKTPEGLLYGVYGLLDDHYDFGFYFSGDTLPDHQNFYLPVIDETQNPHMQIRGFLPWTNFPQSATVYSWNDWKFIIDQSARMRMNFIHIHNYNGMLGHNEPYHNFPYDGHWSRVWMPSVRTGHAWAGPAWNIKHYQFGAYDLFDDYDFTSECSLHNESLTNVQVYFKAASLFKKVIDYAHTRGVKIGLGLDIDLIPDEYEKMGAKADDPGLIVARVRQIAHDYPNLDYLLCFQSEGGGGHGDKTEFYKQWQQMVLHYYNLMKEYSPSTRLAVSGWSMNPKAVAPLPKDIICAPISGYSDRFQPGTDFPNREYWGCPWMERDGKGSQHYYPFDTDLSNTIDAYQGRTENMTGLYTLTWRLTDAIDPKMSYIAKAPWDQAGKYTTSHDVYHEYARRNYGTSAADPITAIINQNEPFAHDCGECARTPGLSGSATRATFGHFMNLKNIELLDENQSVLQTVNAAEFNKKRGNLRKQSNNKGEFLARINRDEAVIYNNITFENAATIRINAAGHYIPGYVEIRTDSFTGPLLAEIDFIPTSGWTNWKPFTTQIPPVPGTNNLVLIFRSQRGNDLDKANMQLNTIRTAMDSTTDPMDKLRLDWLYRRIASVRDYILLDVNFPHRDWPGLPGAFESWAQNFIYRVNDISSLGNVHSTQNRHVQLEYTSRKMRLHQGETTKPPINVSVRGTKDGAVITWDPNPNDITGFHVYRSGKQLTDESLPPNQTSYRDTADGHFRYQVRTLAKNGRPSHLSIPQHCSAGSGDTQAPQLFVISPPTSATLGLPAEVMVRVLDSREYGLISAKLHYKTPSQAKWNTLEMPRKTKAIFACSIPTKGLTDETIEYYIEVTDSDNTAYYPASAPKTPAAVSLVKSAVTIETPAPIKKYSQKGNTLLWSPVGAAYWYRVYRANTPDFTPSPASFLAYFSNDTTSFTDMAPGFDAEPLAGRYYYKITVVNQAGAESQPTKPIAIDW